MSSVKTAASPSSLAIISALGAVYVFWGGTYLGMRFAVETLPPFLMAGTRFLFAGLLMFCFDLSRGNSLPSLKQWCEAGIIGALLLLGGNGCVVWATQIVPSGLSAIIVATVPLWMALFVWLFPGGERPNRSVLFGLLLGFSGILLLVAQNTSPAVSAGFTSGWLLALATDLFPGPSVNLRRRAFLPISPCWAFSWKVTVEIPMGSWYFAGDMDYPQHKSSFDTLVAGLCFRIVWIVIGFSSIIWVRQILDPRWSQLCLRQSCHCCFPWWALAKRTISVKDMAAAAVVWLRSH